MIDLLFSQRWERLSVGGSPPQGRWQHSAVYDTQMDRTIVFGGKGAAEFLSDTWVLTGAGKTAQSPSWVKLAPTGVAPAVHMHSASYHESTARMIVFGGHAAPAFVDDAWVLRDANAVTPAWTKLDPGQPAPSGREWHSNIYDPSSNRLIVFGGVEISPNPARNDVWALTNADGLGGSPAWVQITPTGQVPEGRVGHSAVFDPSTNRMVVFGGMNRQWTTFRNDVWVLLNANGLGGAPSWTQLAPTGPLPSPRSDHSAIYDHAKNRMVVFGGWAGGTTYFNDVWVLSNANGVGGTPTWTESKPKGSLPAKRELHTAVYRPSTDRMIVFGGSSSPESFLDDVWVLHRATKA